MKYNIILNIKLYMGSFEIIELEKIMKNTENTVINQINAESVNTTFENAESLLQVIINFF